MSSTATLFGPAGIDATVDPGEEVRGGSLAAGELGTGDVLHAAQAAKAAQDAAAARVLELACVWADQHPALEPGEEASLVVSGPDGGIHLPLSGEGCPAITEYAVAEFGAVLGESTAAAKRLIGHALELRHRLPRLWDLVHAGRVPVWRARLVATETISTGLTIEAAAWVDSQVSAVAGKVGTAQTQRLVDEAIARFALPPRPSDSPDQRRADLGEADPSSGTIDFHAVVSTADGLDLNHALSHGAATLKALGSTDDLDVRRAVALGDLARHQTALNLLDQDKGAAADEGDAVALPTARELVLHLHFDAALDGDQLAVEALGRLEKGQRLVLLDHVRDWCTDSRTRVSVRPVIDLNETLAVDGYAIPQRIVDHVRERDRRCVFPWCTQPASRTDLNHVIPYDHDAAPTAEANPARRPPPISPASVDDTTDSRHTPDGASPCPLPAH